MVRKTALLLSGLCFIAACSKSDNAAVDTSGTTASTAATDSAAPAAAPALTDANIVYILDNANVLDSSAGAVAATKGTSADVRDFGKMMMRDHHALRQQGLDLAKKLAVTPAAPANDDSQAQSDKTMNLLNTTEKGKSFDKAYIDNEVAYHQAVLDKATAALGAAQNAELKDLITKAAPNIQAHLDKAKSIQSKLQ
jgi:putative membrane protein